MPTVLIDRSSTEPISLDEAKAHLRVEHDEEDALISALVTASREACEHETGRTLVEATWELRLEEFAPQLRLYRPPVLAVDWLRYVDSEGVVRTMDSSLYQVDVDSVPSRLTPKLGTCWPVNRRQPAAVVVRYRAGYGSDGSAVPAPLKTWMLLHLGHYYANREASVTGSISALPFHERLLDCARVWGA